MRLKHLYVVLCIIGIVLPYTQFIPWVVDNGLDVPLLVDQIASSRLAAFGWLDVIVSALALFAFIVSDGRRHQVPAPWLPIVGTWWSVCRSVCPGTSSCVRSVVRQQPRGLST